MCSCKRYSKLFSSNFYIFLLLTIPSFQYGIIHDNAQERSLLPSESSKKLPVPQQQKAFEEHMRNVRNTVGGCLEALTRPGDDFSNCEPLFMETEKELDNLGLFLRRNGKEDLPEVLNNPHNALLYFNQMAHVQQMFLLMLCYKSPTVKTAAEAHSRVFQTKHEHNYTKNTAKKTFS